MSGWGKWSLLHCNKGTDLRSIALCKGIPTKVIQHMATVTEEPTIESRISSGCKTFTLPKPSLAKQHRRAKEHLKPYSYSQTVLQTNEGYWPYCQTGRFNEWERHTWYNSEHRYTESIYTKCEFLSHRHPRGISIANTSAVVFWEFWSCCSNLFMYGKKNRNILAQEGGNSIFHCLWKDWVLLSGMDVVTLISQVILNLSNQNSTGILMLTIKVYFSDN